METITTRWWWVRHAPVDSAGIIYGQMDMPCDTSHLATYEGLAALLPGGAQWVVTPLRRTQQTAAAIIAARGDSPAWLEVPAFMEQNFGEWQGRPRDEVAAKQPERWNQFWLAPAEHAPPGGESFADLVARTRGAVAEISEREAGSDIIAVTHGGTIRAALAVALNLPPAQALAFVVDNCSLTRLDHIAGPKGEAPAWRVVTVNRNPLPSL